MEKRTFGTDREVKALKPADRWYDVKDTTTRNLFVRVGPKNARGEFRRTFIMVTRFPGSKHPTRQAFGEYQVNGRGDLTLEDARERAGEWRRLIRQGIDPREQQRKRREDQDRQRDLTFGSIIEDYIKRHVAGQRKANDVAREIRKEIVPVWKKKPIAEISRRDVVDLIESIADRPAKYQAHNVFGHIRTFFNWAINRGIYGIDTSPCDRLKPGALIGAKKPRQRVLKDDELLAFTRAARRLGYPFGPMFRLLLLTGQRKSEVSDAQWHEFHPELVKLLRERKDEDGPIDWRKVDGAVKVWTVPPERFKSDASHIVPLSDDALAVLEALPLFNEGDYLFSTTFGQKPVSGFSKAKARLDARMLRTLRAIARRRGEAADDVKLEPFVNHDLRRTMRTRLSSLKVPERVAELVVGHGKKGLARVYDQHEFLDEMREAMGLWAGRLREITVPAPANVVKIDKARAR